MFAFIKAFFAGIIAMLAFNQGLLWGLQRAAVAHTSFWNTQPWLDTGVPVVAWLGLWGALWGLIMWLLLRRAEAAGYYVGAIIMASVLMTGVCLAVTPWLDGAVFGVSLVGYPMQAIGVMLAANGAYGLGFAILMRLFHPPR